MLIGIIKINTFRFVFRALVGLIDEEIDNRLNLANIKAEPLNPVVHQYLLKLLYKNCFVYVNKVYKKVVELLNLVLIIYNNY